jgi:hypothetical protein
MSTNKASILEAAIALSQAQTVEIERVGAATGVKLVLDCARSNHHFQVFRGCSGADSAIAEVECRTSRADAGTLIYLALNENQAPGASEIVAHLGKPKSVEVPLQKAGAVGSAIYVYPIAGGELRFAVRTGAPERVLSIAIDRTSVAPRVRVRDRLARWGKADLTPFTA